MAKKLVYVLSDIQKALAFEWIADGIDREAFDLEFILLNTGPTEMGPILSAKGFPVHEIRYHSRLSLLWVFVRTLRLIWSLRPWIIHTHLLTANLVGLTAGWLLRIPKRVYTRHHALIHHEEYPGGYKYDRWCNQVATDIIAPSQNVRSILIDREGVETSKVHLVYHGFDLAYFDQIDQKKLESMKLQYGIDDKDAPVIGSIARYTHWKGVQYTIQAFRQLLKAYPSAKLVLANAGGDYESEIRQELSVIAEDRFVEVKFENDLNHLYQLFDIYVHVPIDETSEAFGQTYVEALAVGVPSVFTLSGVGREFLTHEVNAMVVPHQDAKSIAGAISDLWENPKMADRLVANGRQMTQEKFVVKGMVDGLQAIYSS